MRNKDATNAFVPLATTNLLELIMVNDKLTQLDHTSQLINYQIRNVTELLDKAWYEIELARSDLRDLIIFYEEWEEEIELKRKRLSY